ncbi:hypothetical protein ASG90_07805 [Nocardioides sp. Soil797]|nr:hypothetical protein ASG90_07805 [Nocardioides sp. Soil797]
MDSLKCPKCQADMVSRDLGRMSVDKCPEGHGVFLSRADLAEMIDAENDFHRDGGGFHTAPLPRITADMTTPPPATPKAPAWVATLFN